MSRDHDQTAANSRSITSDWLGGDDQGHGRVYKRAAPN